MASGPVTWDYSEFWSYKDGPPFRVLPDNRWEFVVSRDVVREILSAWPSRFHVPRTAGEVFYYKVFKRYPDEVERQQILEAGEQRSL